MKNCSVGSLATVKKHLKLIGKFGGDSSCKKLESMNIFIVLRKSDGKLEKFLGNRQRKSLHKALKERKPSFLLIFFANSCDFVHNCNIYRFKASL